MWAGIERTIRRKLKLVVTQHQAPNDDATNQKQAATEELLVRFNFSRVLVHHKSNSWVNILFMPSDFIVKY